MKIWILCGLIAAGDALAQPPSPPAVCEVLQGAMNGWLKAPDSNEDDPFLAKSTSPFRQVVQKDSSEPDSPAIAQEKEEDLYQRYFSDVVVNGTPVKLVEVSQGAHCSGDSIELWTNDYRRKLFDASKEGWEWDLHGALDLVTYQGKTYVALKSTDGTDVRLFGFGNHLQGQLTCKLHLAPPPPRLLTSEGDGTVCDAVMAGAVEEVPVEPGERTPLSAEDVGLAGSTEERAEFFLERRTTADIYNDGHPVAVAMAGEEGGGFGCNPGWHDRWPVVLDGKGNIDPSIGFQDVHGDSARLIRFRGVTYVEINEIHDPVQQSHQVWKITRKETIQVCGTAAHYELSR